jgi:exodeoxyribonuclease VII small subunit
MAKTSKSNFESSLSNLEQIVSQLESGDLPIERSLELFEEGVGLARRCQTQLEEAERKVELLLKERGQMKVVPFESLEVAGSDESATSLKPAPSEPADEANRDDLIPF